MACWHCDHGRSRREREAGALVAHACTSVSAQRELARRSNAGQLPQGRRLERAGGDHRLIGGDVACALRLAAHGVRGGDRQGRTVDMPSDYHARHLDGRGEDALRIAAERV